MKYMVLTLVLIGLSFVAEARLEFGKPFRDGAVLQREKPVNVWGVADPGAKVTVSFAGQEKSSVADAAGAWLVTLDPMPASKESRTLAVSTATSNLSIKDILVGEVWFCGGQSNMEFSLFSTGERSRERDGYLTAQMTRKPFIRYCRGEQKIVSHKTGARELRCTWEKFEPSALMRPGTSAIAVYYALELYSALEIPVGVIVAAVGGTDIAPWIPKCGLMSVKGLEDYANWEPKYGDAFKAAEKLPTMTNPSRQPCVLYRAHVDPLTPYSMRGIIWYQGESDRADTRRYALKMHAYYNGMTEVFRDRSLRLYFAQIAFWKNGQGTWQEVRLEQAKFAAEEPNAEMAVTADVGNADEIHPYDKKPVAKRLAAFALRNDYGFKDIQCDSPALESAMSVTGGVVKLSFSHAKAIGVYRLDGKGVLDIELAGPDGVFKPVEIVSVAAPKSPNHYAGNELLVRAKDVAEPKRVTYLRNPSALGALVNEYGLPAGPFDAVVK